MEHCLGQVVSRGSDQGPAADAVQVLYRPVSVHPKYYVVPMRVYHQLKRAVSADPPRYVPGHYYNISAASPPPTDGGL